MRRQHTLPVFIAIMLLAACEKEIPIDTKHITPQVVVSSHASAGNETECFLSMSVPIYGNHDYNSQHMPVDNASAMLFINGVPSTAPVTHSDGIYHLGYTAQPGDHLSLQIDAPGHKTLTASTDIPSMPVVTNAIIADSNTLDPYCNYTLHFSLTDNAADTDYYSIQLIQYRTITRTYDDTHTEVINECLPTIFSCSDFLIVEPTGLDSFLDQPSPNGTQFSGEELLFSDAGINGTTHAIELQTIIYIPHEEGEATGYTWIDHRRPALTVTHLSRDEYLYRKSMQAYIANPLASFFAEPVPIHSNIIGGYGIFAGYSSYTTEFLAQ